MPAAYRVISAETHTVWYTAGRMETEKLRDEMLTRIERTKEAMGE